jgi:hypothetical protein
LLSGFPAPNLGSREIRVDYSVDASVPTRCGESVQGSQKTGRRVGSYQAPRRLSPSASEFAANVFASPELLLQTIVACNLMKISVVLALILTVAAAFAEDAMKFVSPDKSSSLVVDKSGKRDLIELKSGKQVHRLFYDDLDSIFKPKIAEAFNASLNKVGKIVLPTFTSARWTSPDEVEIKGESSVVINDDEGDEFTFTASVSKSGNVKHLSVVQTK